MKLPGRSLRRWTVSIAAAPTGWLSVTVPWLSARSLLVSAELRHHPKLLNSNLATYDDLEGFLKCHL
ncbi:MAG: hypothetical protein ACXW50_23780 [Candidatus Binatia bacterium]